MRNFVIDCFYKEISEKHLVNLQLSSFEMKNFLADCFYKEINNTTFY